MYENPKTELISYPGGVVFYYQKGAVFTEKTSKSRAFGVRRTVFKPWRGSKSLHDGKKMTKISYEPDEDEPSGWNLEKIGVRAALNVCSYLLS